MFISQHCYTQQQRPPPPGAVLQSLTSALSVESLGLPTKQFTWEKHETYTTNRRQTTLPPPRRPMMIVPICICSGRRTRKQHVHVVEPFSDSLSMNLLRLYLWALSVSVSRRCWYVKHIKYLRNNVILPRLRVQVGFKEHMQSISRSCFFK